MKRVILAVALSWLAAPVWAQQQTLIKGEIKSGGYASPVVKLTRLDGDAAVMVGAQGGWIGNHSFALGLGVYGFATATYITDSHAPWPLRLEGGYGGLLLEYYWMPEEVLHLTFGSIIGAGGLVLVEGRRSDWDGHSVDETAFFAAEPSLGVGLNVTMFMRMGLTASYRFVVGSNLVGFDDVDLSDFAISLSLQFGRF